MLSASLLVLFVLSGQHEGIKLFAMLFCSIAVGILCIAITLRRKKEIKKELLPLAVQILAVAALPMLRFLFSSSYASYIPDASQVKYAAISIPYSSEHMYRPGLTYASRTYINNEHMPKTHLPFSMFGFSSQ
ncbi:MAG: hypothetical protein GX851_07875 [Clostridiales bacterium]|nr:hypothetical protein [Clostridiales bacterium]